MKLGQNLPGSLKDTETLISRGLGKLSPLGSTAAVLLQLERSCEEVTQHNAAGKVLSPSV